MLVINKMQEKIEAEREAAREVENDYDSDHPPPVNLKQTPTACRTITLYAIEMQDKIEASELSLTFKSQLNKLIRGSVPRVYSGAQAEKGLQETQLAEAPRAARKKGSQRVILQGGVISVKEARVRIKQRANYDTKALEARTKRVLVRDRKAYLVQVSLAQVSLAIAKRRDAIRQADIGVLAPFSRDCYGIEY
jgi:predicted Zn-dependent protease